jgi:hypothetical protein
MKHADLLNLLQFLHDQMGHGSLQSIYIWISSRFYRPKLYSDIKAYIDSCHSCQLNSTRKPKYDFSGSLGVSGLFLSWSIDFLGPLPTSVNQNSYIFVAVEHLSRYPLAVACKDTTGTTSTQLILTHIISHFGSPNALYLDAGTSFTCNYFQDFAHKWKIDLHFTPPGSHELNGLVERMCGTIRLHLTRSVNSNWHRRDTLLPQIVLGIRSRPASSTGFTPFSVLYGFEPRLPVTPSTEAPALNLALRLIEHSSLPGKHNALLRSPVSPDSVQFPRLSLVLVQRARQSTIRKKTLTRYLGPFRILDSFPHHYYSMVNTAGKVKTFHASRLIPYYPRNDAFFEGGSVE